MIKTFQIMVAIRKHPVHSKRKGKKRWIRDCGRLVRISTLKEENVLKSKDIILLKADATRAIEMCHRR